MSNDEIKWEEREGTRISGISSDGNLTYISGSQFNAVTGENIPIDFIFNKNENKTKEISYSIENRYGESALASDGKSIVSFGLLNNNTAIYRYEVNSKVRKLLASTEVYLDITNISADFQADNILLSTVEVGRPIVNNVLVYNVSNNTVQKLLATDDQWNQCDKNMAMSSSRNVVVINCMYAYEGGTTEVNGKKYAKLVVFDLKNNRKTFIKNEYISNKTGIDSPVISKIIGLDNTGFSFLVQSEGDLPKNKAEKRYFMRYDFAKGDLQAYKLKGSLNSALDIINLSTTVSINPLARSDIFFGCIATSSDSYDKCYLQKVNTGRLSEMIVDDSVVNNPPIAIATTLIPPPMPISALKPVPSPTPTPTPTPTPKPDIIDYSVVRDGYISSTVPNSYYVDVKNTGNVKEQCIVNFYYQYADGVNGLKSGQAALGTSLLTIGQVKRVTLQLSGRNVLANEFRVTCSKWPFA